MPLRTLEIQKGSGERGAKSIEVENIGEDKEVQSGVHIFSNGGNRSHNNIQELS